MANERDEGKGERWRQEVRGKGEVRQALQVKLMGQVGGTANNITCSSCARHEGSPRSRARAVGHDVKVQWP